MLSPLFSFGIIADVQYCDAPDGTSFDGGEKRTYRGSLDHTRTASASWLAANCLFALNLGDTIDGLNIRLGPPTRPREALATVIDALGPLPLMHVVGNHELLNFARRDIPTLFAGTMDTPSPPTDRMYYHSDALASAGWRIVVLDAYDLAMETHHLDGVPSISHDRAVALLKANNPNPCAHGVGGGNFFAGLEKTGNRQRFCPFNGGVDVVQMGWLAATLADATTQGLSCIVVSHVPLLDTPRGGDNLYNCDQVLLWNFEEVLAVLHAAGKTVAVVLSGHKHDGAFGVDSHGIPHITFESPLTHSNGAHGIANVWRDRLELECYGAVMQGRVEGGRPFVIPRR